MGTYQYQSNGQVITYELFFPAGQEGLLNRALIRTSGSDALKTCFAFPADFQQSLKTSMDIEVSGLPGNQQPPAFEIEQWAGRTAQSFERDCGPRTSEVEGLLNDGADVQLVGSDSGITFEYHNIGQSLAWDSHTVKIDPDGTVTADNYDYNTASDWLATHQLDPGDGWRSMELVGSAGLS